MRVRTLVPVLVLLCALPLVAEDSSERAGKLLNRVIESTTKTAAAGTIRFEDGPAEDIVSFSWGVSNSGSTAIGSGGGAGKATFTDFVFTKKVDKSSPQLMKSCATGNHIKDVTITLKDGKGSTYMTIKFNDVLISSYQTGGSGGTDEVFESVALNFAEARIDGILIGL